MKKKALWDPWHEGKRPTIGTDCVILAKKEAGDDRSGMHGPSAWRVLLIERGHEPFKGKWALPGGFMEWGESCEQSAARELVEETSLKHVDLKLLGVFSQPGRDPRGTIVSVSFIGIIDGKTAQQAVGGDDAAKAEWFALDDHPELAFDHQDILNAAIEFLSSNKL